MRNAISIQDEITQLKNEINLSQSKQTSTLKETNKQERIVRKIQSKIDYLNGIWAYVETNPSEEFLNSELARILKAIDVREESYKPLHKDANLSDKRKHKKDYDKKMGTDKLKDQ